MKKLTRLFCVVIALTLAVGGLMTGCGGNAATTTEATVTSTTVTGTTASATTAGIDTSEHVKLNWLLLGDPSKDWDSVQAEINKLTARDLNAEISATFIGWGEFSQKYPLVIMSGQDLDMICTAPWCSYSSYVQKNAFMELTDEMLQKYAPAALEKLPQAAWNEVKVNGKMYAIPRNKIEVNAPIGIAVRGDLMKKYGMTSIASIDDLEKYYANVKKNETNLIPFNSMASDWHPGYVMLLPKGFNWDDLSAAGLTYYAADAKPTALFSSADPTMQQWYKKARDWYNKGYFNKNILNSKVNSQTAFAQGQSASAIEQETSFNSDYKKINDEHPDWDIQFFLVNGQTGPYYRAAYNGTSFAISASSNNTERSLMFLDKLFSDEEYFNLAAYGVKGKHWELTADNKIKVPDGQPVDLYPPTASCPFGMGDFMSWGKTSVNDWPQHEALTKMMSSQANASPLVGISINTDEFKNEAAAINALGSKFGGSLLWGVVDPDKILTKYIEDCKKAGLQKILDSVQKQVDDFVAAKQ